MSRPALKSTQSIEVEFFLNVKASRIKIEWNYTSTPPKYLHGVDKKKLLPLYP